MSVDWSRTLRNAEKLLSRGKVTAAIEEYRKLVNWNPSDLSTLNTFGDLYARAGLNNEAKRIFTRVAQGYRHQGFTSKAIALLKKVVRIDPADLDSAAQLADCYLAQGLAGEAGRMYSNIATAYQQAGREDKALDCYRRMAEIDPSNASLQMALGERWQREGLKQRAHASFMAAGDEYHRQGDSDSALAAYLKGHCVQGDEPRTLRAIASICVAKGHAESAIPILCESLSRDSSNAELLRIIGSTYLSAGRLDDAESTFQKLFVLDAREYANLLVVGEKFLEKGDVDRAVALADRLVDALIANREEQSVVDLLRRVLECDPEHPAALRGLAMIFRRLREDFNLAPTLKMIASAALRRGDRREAIEALEEICSIEPQQPAHRDALQSLGVEAPAEFYTADPAADLAHISTPAEDSNQSIVLRTFADTLGRGETEDAIALLKSAIVREPDNLEFRLALKNAYAGAGLRDLAANEYVQIGRITMASRPPFVATHEFSATPSRYLNPNTDSTAFELVRADNKRRALRVSHRVPLVVISEAGGWREFTETVDISEFGLRLKLAHIVAPMTMLRVSLAMATWPDTVGTIGAMNAKPSIVRYCKKWPGEPNLVGLEFASEEQIPNNASLAENLTDAGHASA